MSAEEQAMPVPGRVKEPHRQRAIYPEEALRRFWEGAVCERGGLVKRDRFSEMESWTSAEGVLERIERAFEVARRWVELDEFLASLGPRCQEHEGRSFMGALPGLWSGNAWGLVFVGQHGDGSLCVLPLPGAAEVGR